MAAYYPKGWFDPARELRRLTSSQAAYPKDYGELCRLDRDNPVVLDFNYWVHGFIGCVFNGGGPSFGLTQFCCELANEISGLLRRRDDDAVDTWRWRVIHLRTSLLALGIPRLHPLDEILVVLQDFLARAGQPGYRDTCASALERLRESWQDRSQSLLAGSIYDHERILVVGHSTLVVKAVQIARLNGTEFSLFCYCPGPGVSSGREQCTGCPFAQYERVRRVEALRLVQDREVDVVFAAACAYHWTRGMVWVTRYAKDIAIQAARAGVPFYPIGGTHKEFGGTTLADSIRCGSEYVDLLDEHDTFETAFLR